MTDEPRYNRDELIAALDAPPEQVERLWNAFGFARRQADEKVFTQRDIDSLKLLASASGVIPDDEQAAMARAIGQTMARLADWQADTLLDLSHNEAITWSVEDMAKATGAIQHLVWRRHLENNLNRDTGPVDPAAAESERLAGVRTTEVVGFADIVGFTSLSRRIDMLELERLLAAFEDRAHEVITGRGGQVVKTLGDAVLFVNNDPIAAAQTGIDILEKVADIDPVPDLCVGMARGEVLNRHGDVFGEPVNIASRLCSSARPGSILVDHELAEALTADERFRVRSIPPLSVRGYRRLRAWALSTPKAERVRAERTKPDQPKPEPATPDQAKADKPKPARPSRRRRAKPRPPA
ncbi:MAG: adenylate/guanylate cyclase domain-containing protein [Gordonia sp. (in: high G+C Gram-positive bacteria)]|uniref:adenylate/guanylate cyclase domain-containing protein n=1 Tax=Gordonia sp. (in: high G+C Gram-positive bacteria) TaxID=84139 RepID=UPI0039E35E25